MRCKEHFQGDRCRKDAQHESEVALKPDPVHVGAFNAWQGSGDSKQRVAVSSVPKPHLKRNRALNRFITRTVPHVRRGIASLDDLKRLEACAKYLQGQKPA